MTVYTPTVKNAMLRFDSTICIMGAMCEEIEILKTHIDQIVEEKVAGANIYRGKIKCVNVVLAQCGIGKVCAAMTATAVIMKYKPHCIINTGVCGSIAGNLNIGDLILAENCVYHDVDNTCFNYKIGQIPKQPEQFKSCGRLLELLVEVIGKGNPYQRGLIVTGDSFVNSETHKKQILSNFPDALGCDMEAAAIAQVCYTNDVPFAMTRAVSDSANKDGAMTFEHFLTAAANHSADIVLLLLERFNHTKTNFVTDPCEIDKLICLGEGNFAKIRENQPTSRGRVQSANIHYKIDNANMLLGDRAINKMDSELSRGEKKDWENPGRLDGGDSSDDDMFATDTKRGMQG